MKNLIVLVILFLPIFSIAQNSTTKKSDQPEKVLPPPPVVNEKYIVNKQNNRKPLIKEEVEAKVDVEIWRSYLATSLKGIVDSAKLNNAPKGEYKVEIRFAIDTLGTIIGATALNNPGYNIGEYISAVVNKGPKWSPAISKGKKIRSFHTQLIVLVIE